MNMQTIGFMTKYDLNAIVNTIVKQSSNTASLRKSNLIVQVSAPNGDLVLSAAAFKIANTTRWHVRAVPGLIKIGV